ncbi:MAG: DUF5715 family protein [Bacteroides sp.]|nr:DUF5715 family protein [Bacteroides sp.]MCM1413055.1 DUF5715 family protein [Bacteroides sp.]MCM1471761.1 DUF5715 family protein [Bacteroides sp.]
MRFPLYIFLLLLALTTSCSHNGSADAGEQERRAITLDDIELDIDSTEGFDNPLSELPEPTVSMRTRNIGNLAKLFNDSNYVHWADAEKLGFAPLTDTRSHWKLDGRSLEKVVPCKDFYVEPLTYSQPYLVPRAAAMLHEIGRRFNDSLEVRGGGEYRIKVTSVLRTPENVARLRRRNRNAIDSSVHQLGTTFDISWARFAPFGTSVPRSMVDLKSVLAEVLLAMRQEGKIWVKYEIKQPCFHITARPPQNNTDK